MIKIIIVQDNNNNNKKYNNKIHNNNNNIINKPLNTEKVQHYFPRLELKIIIII